MNRLTATQERILEAMHKGTGLSSMLSTDMGEYGACLDRETVPIASVRALLRKGLISEKSKSLCSDGFVGSKPLKRWSISYQLVEEGSTNEP